MQRVLVIGSGGAGKSAFACRLAEKTGLPLVHLDQLYWRPGWTEPSPDAWEALVRRRVAEPRWIMDGNYGGTLEQRLAACDTAIFLDLPRSVCVWRVIQRRIWFHGRSRPDMTAGCPEQLSLKYLWWILTYPERRRPGIIRRLKRLRQNQRALILLSTGEVERFVASL